MSLQSDYLTYAFKTLKLIVKTTKNRDKKSPTEKYVSGDVTLEVSEDLTHTLKGPTFSITAKRGEVLEYSGSMHDLKQTVRQYT